MVGLRRGARGFLGYSADLGRPAGWCFSFCHSLACGTHYKSVGSANAPGSEEFYDRPPSVKAHCAYVDERGGYDGDWFSADYLICVEPKGRFCYGHTSLLYGDQWQLVGFDDACWAADRAAVKAGDLPAREGET